MTNLRTFSPKGLGKILFAPLALIGLLLGLLLASNSAYASTASVKSASGASGGSSGTASWKVYGNGVPTSGSTTSKAWQGLVNSSYTPCGINCRSNFTGTGALDWSSVASTCEHSAYIWDKETSGYTVQSGFAQTPSSVASHLPTTATSSGTSSYATWRTQTVNYLATQSGSYIDVICSSSSI